MSEAHITLVSHPLCPFVQRAEIVLLEKGVPFDRLNIHLAAKPAWFLDISPNGKVPLLRVRQQDGTEAVIFETMYPRDALARARQRGWAEFGTATLADAWQFLNATDRPTADAKQAAFRHRLQQLEVALGSGPYFNGAAFGMVDAVGGGDYRCRTIHRA